MSRPPMEKRPCSITIASPRDTSGMKAQLIKSIRKTMVEKTWLRQPVQSGAPSLPVGKHQNSWHHSQILMHLDCNWSTRTTQEKGGLVKISRFGSSAWRLVYLNSSRGLSWPPVVHLLCLGEVRRRHSGIWTSLPLKDFLVLGSR